MRSFQFLDVIFVNLMLVIVDNPLQLSRLSKRFHKFSDEFRINENSFCMTLNKGHFKTFFT